MTLVEDVTAWALGCGAEEAAQPGSGGGVTHTHGETELRFNFRIQLKVGNNATQNRFQNRCEGSSKSHPPRIPAASGSRVFGGV